MDHQQQQLIARGLQNGQAEAWHALYDACARRIWASVARRVGPDAADVANVVQETFLGAARNAHQFDLARARQAFRQVLLRTSLASADRPAEERS